MGTGFTSHTDWERKKGLKKGGKERERKRQRQGRGCGMGVGGGGGEIGSVSVKAGCLRPAGWRQNVPFPATE